MLKLIGRTGPTWLCGQVSPEKGSQGAILGQQGGDSDPLTPGEGGSGENACIDGKSCPLGHGQVAQDTLTGPNSGGSAT